MSEFTAKKLKEARVRAGFTQDEAAKLMNLKKTTMSEMEAGKRSISADELAQFSRIYEVDVRELLFLEFTEAGEEQRLAAKYSSFFKLLEKLSDRDITLRLISSHRLRVTRQIKFDGTISVFSSSGSTTSDIQITAPVPTVRDELFSTEKDFAALLSGALDFLISTGWRTPSSSMIRSISFILLSR